MNRLAQHITELRRSYIVTLLCLAAGVTAGSLYFVSLESAADSLAESITAAVSAGGGPDRAGIIRGALFMYVPLWLFVFCGGFAKPGVLLSAAADVRYGFSSGFGAAAFFASYGIKGALIPLAAMPSEIVFALFFVIFSSVSINAALRPKYERLAARRSYIFLSILALSIFCGVAVLKGVFATIFMVRSFSLLR